MRVKALDIFHPLIARWFTARVGRPTDVQEQAWRAIAAGEHVLLTAPTGSGKTMAAFLWSLNQLAVGAWKLGALRTLYVSPLKALNNDIQRNLLDPLAELETVFREAGESFPEIRVQTRSGDTPSYERQRMIRRPPEILITTPESLNLLHSSPKGRRMLEGIQTVILDEIHAVAATKRGTHLITAVDRLHLMNGEFQRIGLSATVKPLRDVADFMGGYRIVDTDGAIEYKKRPVTIVKSRAAKTYDLSVRFPPIRAAHPEDGARWPALVESLRALIAANRSTLIFTNTRRHCERISLLLNEDADEILAYAHHGSLSHEMRAVVEERLKAGSLSAIVATSSLEWGIDIGALDQVVLIQTPFSVSATLQRLGRAGHQVGQVSRGVLFPLHGRDILEAAVMAKAVEDGDIESIRPVSCPLDVLAQIIVSMTGVEQWDLGALHAFLRSSTPYHHLSETQFNLVIGMLSGRYADARIRSLNSLVYIDRADNTIEAKPGALRTLYSSGGTIPDRGYFNLRLKDSLAKIGELDEEFVWERHLGETFTFGTQTWKIQQITHNDVLVTPGGASPEELPFWKADQISRGFHFSERTAEFLEAANGELGTPAFREMLQTKHCLDHDAAQALDRYLQLQKETTGADLPHRHHILIENCADPRSGSEHVYLILHTLWGGAVNRPLALAMAQAWEEQLGETPDAHGSNDCVVLLLRTGTPRTNPFDLVDPEDIEALLRKKLEQTGLFGARFRTNAARALLLPKKTFGKRMPLWMTRIRSKKLFDAVAKYDDFPIVAETWRTCLQDEFEMDTLRSLLREVRSGEIRLTEIETQTPSPFAKDSLWGQTNKFMYADDSPLQPIVSNLSDDILNEVVHSADLRPQVGREPLDTFVAKAQRTHPGYAPGTPQELLDWVKERVFICAEEWEALLSAMERDHGLNRADIATALAPKLANVTAGTPGVFAQETVSRLESVLPSFDGTTADDVETSAVLLSEWLRFYGPIERKTIVQKFPLVEERLGRVLESLHERDAVVLGHLTAGSTAIEVCDRENLEILLRLMRRDRRPVFEALPLETLPAFLAAHQGIPASADDDMQIAEVLEILQGYPSAPELLEKEYLPARANAYRTDSLDTFAHESGLMWMGTVEKKVFVTLPATLDLFADPPTGEAGKEDETEEAAAALFPSAFGRYTFGDLEEYSSVPAAQLTASLWQGVWQGQVVNDSFEALRTGIRTRFKGAKTPVSSRTSRRAAFRSWKASRGAAGYWRLAPRPGAAETLLDEAELVKDRVRVVFDRYGVLFRQLLNQELAPLRWGALFRALRLMELSGEIVAGHFFDGIPGLQFASQDALRRLQAPLAGDTVFWLNATDPASPCGLDLEGFKGRYPKRLKTTHLVFHGSRLVLVSKKSGNEIDIHVEPEDSRLPLYLDVFDHLLGRAFQPMANLSIETINQQPATDSPYLDLFRQQFEVQRDPKKVSLWKKR